MKLIKIYKIKNYLVHKIQNIYKINRHINFYNKPLIFAWHINDWKQDYIRSLLKENMVYFFPFNLTKIQFEKKWKKKILSKNEPKILIWGMEYPDYLKEFIHEYNIKVTFVEDGFIRSIGLGSNYELPISLNFDSKTLYFNAEQESDLESILNTYDFKNDPKLMTRAVSMKNKLLSNGISKYNHADNINLESIYGKKTKKRILVIGQVEDDASIKYGCHKKMNNNDLVRIARKENPSAQIIYKPHPDVLFKRRKALSNPDDVKDIALVVKESFPISQALDTIDHVYTITSQVGFEALLRNIEVTTIGLPFYAGWGLTNEHQSTTRRTRTLTIDELFAGAYILYPKYYDYSLRKLLKAEEALDRLILLKDKSSSSWFQKIRFH